MTKIRIGAKDLGSSLSAELEPGGALLIGRAPDPSRINWSALAPQQTSSTLPSLPTAESTYRIATLALSSSQVSANHALVIGDDALTTVYDLGSRNGSCVQVSPQRPVLIPAGQEVGIILASMSRPEARLSLPKDAEWTEDAGFSAAVEQSLVSWLRQIDTPIQVIRWAPGSSTDGFQLADDSYLELKEVGTLEVPGSTLLEMVCEYIHDQNTRFLQLKRRVSGMVAVSPAIRQILARTAEAAAGSRRTLILGPTGVGKELLARSYHAYSPRHDGPFVTVNCALLDKDLLYAQLFGARRGSFTGAISDVGGLIDAAKGGTLFLDELGEMSPEVQTALLRFLDSRGEYHRLGETQVRRADVQLIGASNAPLDDPGYRSNHFRDDLWYRLAGAVIAVPPLCERPEDIKGMLASRRLPDGKWSVAECLTEDALALLLRDPWPGNFRDLENFIARLPAVARPHSIDRERCERALHEGRPKVAVALANVAPAPAATLSAVAGTAPPLQAEPPGRPSGKSRTNVAVPPGPTNATLGWERIVQVALGGFLEDQAEQLAGWDQLQLFVEHYLKPMFVANAATNRNVPGSSRVINYSELARRLHISDGSTVKTHLSRFEERFAERRNSSV